jgi:YbgC/YbaW family acyl-CoA thioester hydrolase
MTSTVPGRDLSVSLPRHFVPGSDHAVPPGENTSLSELVLMQTPTLETEVRVMFFDTDAGGVVHNIAYLRFIETNRSLLAEKLGYPLEQMLNRGNCPVVVRTEIDYRRPGRLWDALVVRGELAKFERSRFWCAFTITRPSDGALLVTCQQMLVVVQLPELKVQRLPSHWQADFGHLRA